MQDTTPTPTPTTPYTEPLASERLVYGDKKIFLDVLETHRGLSLRIRERLPGRPSSHILLPVEGDSLDRFIEATTSLAQYAHCIRAQQADKAG